MSPWLPCESGYYSNDLVNHLVVGPKPPPHGGYNHPQPPFLAIFDPWGGFMPPKV